MPTVKHEPGETEWGRAGNAVLTKIGSALCIPFALLAVGFGVYEFVHTEFSKGSLSFLIGIVILNFALH
jgi:hypothetical protein